LPTNKFWSGIQLEWACGNRELVDATSNNLRDWNQYGFEVTQSSDVDVNCNEIKKNTRALEFSRDAQATGPQVRFFNNTVDSSTTVAIRTNHGGRLKASTQNALRTVGGVDLIENTDASRTLDARTNAWFMDGTLWTDPDTIDAYTVGRVDSTGAIAEYVPPLCQVPGPEAERGRGERVLAGGEDGDDAPGVTGVPVVPAVTRLLGAHPSPGRGPTRVFMDVAPGDAGIARIVVYDVRGRRVRTVWRGPLKGGRRDVFWDGRDETGKAVAAGIYFIRMEVGDVVEVRKIVRLQ
jgi:hypothetical protein